MLRRTSRFSNGFNEMQQRNFGGWCWFGTALIVCYCCCGVGAVVGGEIELKNGTVLRGNVLLMETMTSQAVGFAEMDAKIFEDERQKREVDPKARNIVRVDTGWQRFYVPVRQVKGSKLQGNVLRPKPVLIIPPKPKRQGQEKMIGTFGSLTFVDNFDDYGKRRVMIETQKGPMQVFQAITEISPDHVMVESTNCDWKLGMSLKSIPLETIDKMAHRKVKGNDPVGRFKLVDFYSQAELYAKAFSELETIGRDFRDDKAIVDLVQKSREELMNYFGGQILRRLEGRKRAGQHAIAETFANKLAGQSLSGAVQQKVQEYVRSYEQSRQEVERAKSLLSDWQSKLKSSEQEHRLHPLRSEINEQLDIETLPRLDAFLKAESDNQYQPEEHLGLAYSGWILGAANAVPDLDQAFRVWDARQLVVDYLSNDDPNVHAEQIRALQSMEGVSPKIVLSMIAQLPPILDATEVRPGTAHKIELSSGTPAGYSVILPAEYSPHHSYPMIVALRPGYRSTDQTLKYWAGDSETPDLANQRGYIVIAPEYAAEKQVEHTYGAPAHKLVLDCLIDARNRFSVDSNRVFLVGQGMGADAAFDIGMAHPDEFAGVIPVGGNALNYCTFYWQNGSHTAWYVVGKGYASNGDRDPASNKVYEPMLKQGYQFDFTLVEYLGRSSEYLYDDFPKLFDWMDSHVRPELPKDFTIRSLRKTDNRHFWVTAHGLPRDYILPAAMGAVQKISAMEIHPRVTPGNNTIALTSVTDSYTLRLLPELIDFEKRLVIRVGEHSKFNNFVKPEIVAILEELRLRGDRRRLPLAVIAF